MKIHTLANGATVIVTSPGHGFKFSDGTECGPQDKEVRDKITCQRRSRQVGSIKGMPLMEVRMVLSEEQLAFLRELAQQADIVLIPFPVLTALREAGVRDHFPNVVAMNATIETQSVAPDQKVIDINNWSY